jgi:hypothetical protein
MGFSSCKKHDIEPPEITTMLLESGMVGSTYSQRVNATSSTAVTWTVSTGLLPPGLTIDSKSGDISGTPIVMGIYGFVLTADNGLTNQKGFNITIVDNSGNPVIVTANLPDGVIATAYSQTIIATGAAPIIWSLTGGALPAGLNLNAATGEIYGAPTAVGTATFTVTATYGEISVSRELKIEITATPIAPVITTESLPNVALGAEYNQMLAATGTGPINWSISGGSLPAGLSLDASTGLISGTPTAAGTATFTVTATNNALSQQKGLSITVTTTVSDSPSITTTSLPNGAIDTAYIETLDATGATGTSPISWSITDGELPAGLSLNASTGEISGAPTAAGKYTFTVTANNGIGDAATKELSITVIGTTQSTGWIAPTAANYEYSATYVTQIAFDGDLSKSENTEVAAFVGDEIRGFGKLSYDSRLKVYLVHITVYSNTASGETISLKAYDTVTKTIYTNCTSFVFQSNAALGSSSEILDCKKN